MSHASNGSNGRLALVTGGSRGIGRAVVEGLSDAGFSVVFCSRSEDSVRAAEKELLADGRNVYGMVADVRDRNSVSAFVDAALEKANGDGIHVLVNNAGRPGGGPTKDIDDETWDDVIETNLNTVFRVTREVLQRGGMLERKEGRIINIASTGGKQGVPLGAPYSASKAGVIAFTKALGKELAPTGVTVNAVCPGFTETDMARGVREHYGRIWNLPPEEVLKRFQARIPTGRYVEPQEVAEMVVFLASTGATSITAQALNVCGGLGNF